MSLDSTVNLPVSLGEAIDKLTILHIKTEKIKNEKNIDAQKEYDTLYEILETYITKYQYYYNILKNINLKIWEAQDNFRYSSDESKKTKLCKEIIIDNDRRFRVKNKINNICNSYFKEVKGYKLKKCFVLTHLGLGDNITSIGMVRYLSTMYDSVVVVCKNHNKKNVDNIYSDDTNIKLYLTEDYKLIDPIYGKKTFEDETAGMDVYVCGISKRTPRYDIPFSFYDDVKIDSSVFWEYFHIPSTEQNEKLYSCVKNIDYVFIHNTSSSGVVFTPEYVENKLNINKNEILFINPSLNLYEKNHKYHRIADLFTKDLLIDYAKSIIHAKYVILSDSSFFSMAINLEIKTDNCFYISRNNRNYKHLYEDKYVFDENIVKRKKFIEL